MLLNLPICVCPYAPTFPLSTTPTPHLLQTSPELNPTFSHIISFSHLLSHCHWHTNTPYIAHLKKEKNSHPISLLPIYMKTCAKNCLHFLNFHPPLVPPQLSFIHWDENHPGRQNSPPHHVQYVISYFPAS